MSKEELEKYLLRVEGMTDFYRGLVRNVEHLQDANILTKTEVATCVSRIGLGLRNDVEGVFNVPLS